MTIQLATRFDFVCAWNTGRPYQGHGQHIVVFQVVVDGEVVAYYMNDISRIIEYFWMPLDFGDLTPTPSEVRAYVMNLYDWNADGFQVWQHKLMEYEGFDTALAEARYLAHRMEPSEFPRWSPRR